MCWFFLLCIFCNFLQDTFFLAKNPSPTVFLIANNCHRLFLFSIYFDTFIVKKWQHIDPSGSKKHPVPKWLHCNTCRDCFVGIPFQQERSTLVIARVSQIKLLTQPVYTAWYFFFWQSSQVAWLLLTCSIRLRRNVKAGQKRNNIVCFRQYA